MRVLRRAVLFFGLAACAVAAAPTVASVSPNSGPSTGGTPITITGTGFTGATDVTIGGNSLGTGGYLVVNATTITLSTPSGTVGPASVVVITPGGSSPANTLFTYLPAPPSVGGITPNTGSTEGGTKLTIVGSGFTGATAVTIGGVPATGISAKNDTQITVTTGPGTAGNSSVAVTTPNGTSYPNKLFTYITPGTILYTQILGQPTDHNATINIQANAALDISYRYGAAPGTYSGTTGMVSAAADPYTAGAYVAQAVLSGLQPDTAYYYQIQYRLTGSGATFTAGAERVFHTQRLPGSTFVFTVQGDSHPERVLKMFHSDLYNKTLSAAAAENPDFHITSGDDFSVDTIALPYTQPAVSARYTLQLPYFNLLNTSALFLGTGNHEETSLFNYNLPADPTNNSNQVATWAQNARNLYYASPGPSDPITGTFYTGNQTQLPNINGYLRDYYAWTWGDALFVVIDPYWGSPSMVDTPLGANSSGTSKNSDGWSKSHGNAQYQWLAQTLQSSKAKWKFIFAHHVMGTGRGGVEVAPLYEWGGSNANGTPGFAANRQPFNDGTLNYSWPEPIHKLLVDNNVTIFFGAHDHIYVHQQLDGVHYQALPNPGDNTYTAFNADAYTQPGQSLYPDAGYVKVTVASTGVKVDYVREFLPQDETATLKSGMIQDSYTIGAVVTPPPTCTYALNLSGAGYASTGGAGTIAVTTGAGCAWSVTGVPLWVTLLSGASRTGSGTVSYQVTSNTGGTRTAAMTVAGVAFNVEQTAAAGVISGLVPVGSLAQVNAQGGWGFELDAVNVGTTPATARVNFTDPSGNALPLPLTFPQTSSSGIELASTFDRTVNPNARVVITSTGSTTAPTLLGSGQLLSNGSVSGFGIFSFPALQWNAVVPLETRNANAYYLPFDNMGVLHTGVALSNITASAVSIQMAIRNDAGTQIRTDTILLPAQGYQQCLLDTQYTQTAGLRGSVQFTTESPGQISVLGVRANGAALTTLPVLSNLDPAGGSISDVTYNGGFTSTFYLVNTGSSAASFTLSFFDQNGNPANVPLLLPQTGVSQSTTALTQTLAAGQMLEVATQANDAAANISGSAQLTSTGNVSGFEIFRWNTYAQEASVPLETRTPGSYLLVFDNTSPLNTGVSLTNAIALPAIIPTTIYDDQGNVLQTATVALPGRGQQVFMLSANYPITAGKRGMVQFTVPSTGPISMIGIRTSGTTLTTVPILTK